MFNLISFQSCLFNPPATFENRKSINNSDWDYENLVNFEVTIEDTEPLYDIFIFVRHSGTYEYANCWVNVHTTFPNGEEQIRPVNLPLADDRGKWYGTGSGDVINTEILIQQRAKLPETGKYLFEIEQFMRVNPLKEISDIGLIIRESQNE